MALSDLEYWRGVVISAAILGILLWGAVRLRRRLVPTWDGALARTAEATLASLALFSTAQALAAVHQLGPGATGVALVAVGALMAVIGRGRVQASTTQARGWSGIRTLAIVAIAAVVAQWSAVTAMAFRGGMTQTDTLWYHGPFTARFLQDRTLGDLEGVGYAAARYFPLDSELLHALVAMPFRSSDIVSPLVNLGFLALAITAAAAIGQVVGGASLGVLGALVGLSFPALVSVDAGAASSDVAAAAYLLAAVAMLMAGDELEVAPSGLAGGAAGLALGCKLTVAVPVAALTVGVLVLLWRRRHLAAALAWIGGLVVGAGAWFVRNVALTDSPLPYFDVHIGPLRLEAAATQDSPALLEDLFDLETWRVRLPTFAGSMGRAWPLVLGGVAALVVAIVVRGPTRGRIAAVAVLAAAAGHVVTPMTGGLTFENNLRYLHPALVVGGALLPVALVGVRPNLRRAAAVAVALIVAVNLATADKYDFHRWPSEHRGLAVVVGLLVVGVGLAAAGGRLPRSVALGALGGLAAAFAVVGALGHERYAEGRYVDAAVDRIALYRPFHGVRDQRVAVVGSQDVYPMFGPDLSNEVQRFTTEDRRQDLPACLAWRELLAGRFDYVAVIPYVFTPMDMHLDELVDDPAAELLVRNELGAVYRIDGALDTARCGSVTQG